jgi:hypothetical protein
MKRKIICVIISLLFFCTIIPMTSAVINIDTIESPEPEPIGGYFIFGFMKLIDPEDSITDFEIVSFIFLIGKGEFIRLNEGEMIEIHEPIFGIIFNNLFVGYIGDYSMIG